MGRAVVCCVYVLLFALSASASDWPHWRGPNRDGTSDEKGLLDAWPETGPVKLWEAEIGPGIAKGNYRVIGASPSVAAGRVYVAGRFELADPKNPDDVLFCFDARDGKLVWKHTWRGDRQRVCHGTPTIAGGRVFFLDSIGRFMCLDAADGKVLWEKSAKETGGNFKGNNPSFGGASSPVVDDGVVYVGLAAFRVADGTPVYPAKEWNLYNALALGTVAGHKVLCHNGSGYDARSGEQLWEMRNCAGISMPVFLGDRLLLYGQEPEADPIAKKHPRLYRIRAENDKLTPELVWAQDAVSGFTFHLTNFQTSSPVVVGGHAWAWFGSGMQRHGVACIELASGKVTWGVDGRRIGMAGECFSSPIVADGKIFALDGTGQLFMMKVDPAAFALLAKAKVCERTYASPVLADGRLYIRDDRRLLCLKVR